MGFSSAPYFSSRIPVQFLSADQPSLSITGSNSNLLLNNMAVYKIDTGSVAQIAQGCDGLNYLQGDGEYAPLALELTWKQLGINDYIKLAALRPYYITFVDYRNNGFYGKLIMDGPQSTASKVQDVVSCKGTFFVLAPSGAGGANTVNTIPTPTTLAVANSNTANSGYIAASLATYYWLTFSSKYGETLAQASGSISNANANTYNAVSWAWPTSTAYCTKASVYVSNASTASSSRLIGEVPNGLTPTYTDYVGFQSALVNRQPPSSVSMAYRGSWLLGLWGNEP